MNPDAAEHRLLMPILSQCDDPDGRPVLEALRRATGEPSLHREAWRDIPAAVEAVRQFWMPSRFARGA